MPSVDRIGSWPTVLLMFACVVPFATTLARSDPENVETEVAFELPIPDDQPLLSGTDPDLDDVSVVGNPLQRLAKQWPEDLVIAPVPGRSPQLGWTLNLVGAYFLPSGSKDPEAAKSSLGGFAMAADNGSSVFGAFVNLHLLDDDLRVKAGGVSADVRYRFYGIGNEAGERGIGLDVLQKGPIYLVSGSWRAWKRLYIGAGYLRGNIDTRLRLSLPSPAPFFDPSVKLDIAAYTIPLQVDSRDHQQFPRRGWLVDASAKLYRESAGSDFDAETYSLSVNHYRPIREQDVLASRLFFRAANGDAPFFLLSSFGGSSDLRGYPSGRYRDRVMYALQSEYRWRFNDRWIFTGFAGIGEVADSFSDVGKNLLPAGGIGARFVLSQKHRVSLSADLAVGNDGAEFYFGIGEAF